jgi:hypothetical protein
LPFLFDNGRGRVLVRRDGNVRCLLEVLHPLDPGWRAVSAARADLPFQWQLTPTRA